MKITQFKPFSYSVLLLTLQLLLLPGAFAQEQQQAGPYQYREGDPNGSGKWYMGREIALVMGYQGMAWLERASRERQEGVSRLLKNLELSPGDTVADIGAGSGYHTFRMAPKIGNGLVYAVDLQPEMLQAMQAEMETSGSANVVLVQGSETAVNLPPRSIDKVLMVDVYHEFSHPREMMLAIKNALRPDGRVYLVEYRGEDPGIPIKRLHKMTEQQAVKELQATGFRLIENITNLPLQHCMVFELK